MIFHHTICGDSSSSYIWKEETTAPFNELILSWNAERPLQGLFAIGISVKIEGDWSPWFAYSSWGSDGQRGGDVNASEYGIRIDQDILEIYGSHKATGFRVAIEAKAGASLGTFRSIHANTLSLEEISPKKTAKGLDFINLSVPLISQMKLSHPRHRDLCSPTAATSVVSYLLKKQIDPIHFALNSHDSAFDKFGNWVLNMAQASTLLGGDWRCWVQRMGSFEDVYSRLKMNTPIVVSVKGPLPGSSLPYDHGHLLVIKGFDPIGNKVLCMDPAFPEDSSTDVSYGLHDLLEAWSRRGCLAYVFEKCPPIE